MTNSDGKDDPNDVAQSSIGQLDDRMTPMLGAMIAGSVANGGVEMRPYLISKMQDSNLKTTYVGTGQQYGTPITPAVATQLQQMCDSVVQNGTATSAKISGYEIGGKTGTARQLGRWRGAPLVHRIRDQGRPTDRVRGRAPRQRWRPGHEERTEDRRRHSQGRDRRGRQQMTTVTAGLTLAGRYRLTDHIAGGGMGDVWRCHDEVLGRTVAVKVLLPALVAEPGFTERFRDEARTMATINHPGVVNVYDYGSDQGVTYLVMEYVEGDALSKTLTRVGRLTPARTMSLMAQAADALQAAHDKGIVHRDVKPANLLVRPNGTLVLTDFGIARSASGSRLTAVGFGARHGVVHLSGTGLGRGRHARLGHLRARRRRLPVPFRPAALRGWQSDRDRHAARGSRPATVAGRHPAERTRPRRSLPAEVARGPVAERRLARRRRPSRGDRSGCAHRPGRPPARPRRRRRRPVRPGPRLSPTAPVRPARPSCRRSARHRRATVPPPVPPSHGLRRSRSAASHHRPHPAAGLASWCSE